MIPEVLFFSSRKFLHVLYALHLTSPFEVVRYARDYGSAVWAMYPPTNAVRLSVRVYNVVQATAIPKMHKR